MSIEDRVRSASRSRGWRRDLAQKLHRRSPVRVLCDFKNLWYRHTGPARLSGRPTGRTKGRHAGSECPILSFPWRFHAASPRSPLRTHCQAESGLLSRRQVLWAGVSGVLAGMTTPLRAIAAGPAERALGFASIHTGEVLSVVYRVGDAYQEDALARVNHQLRDHRTGEVKAIEPALLDLLHDLSLETGTREPYQVISGYRSPATNEMLRTQGSKVGRRSYHMKGMAIDLRLADVGSRRLREAALDLKRGGVGYYAKSDFVHLDVGPVRLW